MKNQLSRSPWFALLVTRWFHALILILSHCQSISWFIHFSSWPERAAERERERSRAETWRSLAERRVIMSAMNYTRSSLSLNPQSKLAFAHHPKQLDRWGQFIRSSSSSLTFKETAEPPKGLRLLLFSLLWSNCHSMHKEHPNRNEKSTQLPAHAEPLSLSSYSAGILLVGVNKGINTEMRDNLQQTKRRAKTLLYASSESRTRLVLAKKASRMRRRRKNFPETKVKQRKMFMAWI